MFKLKMSEKMEEKLLMACGVVLPVLMMLVMLLPVLVKY